MDMKGLSHCAFLTDRYKKILRKQFEKFSCHGHSQTIQVCLKQETRSTNFLDEYKTTEIIFLKLGRVFEKFFNLFTIEENMPQPFRYYLFSTWGRCLILMKQISHYDLNANISMNVCRSASKFHFANSFQKLIDAFDWVKFTDFFLSRDSHINLNSSLMNFIDDFNRCHQLLVHDLINVREISNWVHLR